MMAIAYTSKMRPPKAVGQVHDYIANTNCKGNYITYSKPACKDGQCHPLGTQNGCTNIDVWQWQHPKHTDVHRRFHAAGINPHPAHRVTANGNGTKKSVWAYVGDITEGEAQEIYNPAG